MRSRLILAALVVLFVVQTLSAQGDWHKYPFRDLETFISGEQSLYDKSGKADMAISANPFPSKTRVFYMGKRRDLSEYGKSFIRMWTQSLDRPAGVVDQLLEEFLFVEKGKEYWMPVQKGTAKGISQNLRPGDEIIIYYFYLGGYDPKMMLAKDTSPTKPSSVESEKLRLILAVERVETLGTEFPLKRIEDTVDKKMVVEDSTKDIWINPRMEKLTAKLVYAGKIREVKGKRMQLRDSWLNQFAPTGTEQLLQSEALFKDGEKEYWIILWNKARDHLKAFVKQGDTLFVKSIVLGTVKNSNRTEWVLSAGDYSTF